MKAAAGMIVLLAFNLYFYITEVESVGDQLNGYEATENCADHCISPIGRLYCMPAVSCDSFL